MAKSVNSFKLEIYQFLHTTSAYSKFFTEYFIDKIYAATGITIPLERTPYIQNMCGEYYQDLLVGQWDNPLPVDTDPCKNDTRVYIRDLVSDIDFELSATSIRESAHSATLDAYGADFSRLAPHIIQNSDRFDFIKACMHTIRIPDTFDISGFGSPIEIIGVPSESAGNGMVVVTDNFKEVYPLTHFAYFHDLDIGNVTNVFSTLVGSIGFGNYDTVEPDRVQLDRFIRQKVFGTPATYLASLKEITLVGYGDGILEDSEQLSIVLAIEEFIQTFNDKCMVTNLVSFEKYAPLVAWNMFWLLLPLIILLQRSNNINTSAAHTDLIWEKLISEGLRDYRDILTRDQSLFLYKNIAYLKQMRGSAESVGILVENLLHPHDLRLRAKHLAIRAGNIKTDCYGIPEIISKEVDANHNNFLGEAFGEFATFEEIYRREVANGLEPAIGPMLVDDQIELSKYSYASTLPTKLIEIIDNRIVTLRSATYRKFAFESMLYAMSLDAYEFVIDDITFNTGEIISLTAKQTLAFAYYLHRRGSTGYVRITEETKEQFYGNTFLYGDTLVTIDYANVELYFGAALRFVGPIDIPNKTVVAMPFTDSSEYVPVDLFAVSQVLEDDEAVVFDIREPLGLLYDDDGSTVMGRSRQVEWNIMSARGMVVTLDELFSSRLEDYADNVNSSDGRVNIAFQKLYQSAIKSAGIEIDFGIPHDTFDEWFAATPTLFRMVDALNKTSNSPTLFIKTAAELFDKVLDITDSQYIASNSKIVESKKLLSELFAQLCSYDIAFIDSDPIVPAVLPQIVTTINDYATGIMASESIVRSSAGFTHRDAEIITDESIELPPPIVYDPYVDGVPEPPVEPVPPTVRGIMEYEETIRSDSKLSVAVVEDKSVDLRPLGLRFNINLVGGRLLDIDGHSIRTSHYPIGELIPATATIDPGGCDVTDDVTICSQYETTLCESNDTGNPGGGGVGEYLDDNDDPCSSSGDIPWVCGAFDTPGTDPFGLDPDSGNYYA